MAEKPTFWLLWLLMICCLQHSSVSRRYDRCNTREGRSGICVAKRFCREAASSPRHALTACPGTNGFYCCPVPTGRSAAEPNSSDGVQTPHPDRSTYLETSTQRPVNRYQTPQSQSRPSSSSTPNDETYRHPERSNIPTGAREKQPVRFDQSGSESRHLQGDGRFDERERSSTRRPRSDTEDREHVTKMTTRRPIPTPTPPPPRSTSPPHKGNGRTPPPEKHTDPAVPIKFPESYKPPHPPAPACGQKPYELLIAGGEESKQHEWPWMVAIFRRHASPKPKTYICGGSLINSRYILSAAHCFIHNYVILPASTFMVRLGAHYLDSGEDYTVASLILHQNHSGSEFFNDIALLRLASEVFFTDKIAPICLPNPEMRYKTFVDRMAIVSGWGATAFYRTADSRVLQHVTVPVLSNEECASAYSRVRGAAFLARGTDHIICAGLREGGKDACLGDSGGPLMLKTKDDSWTVIGIVSLGYKCAEPGYPGVYTRVTHYLNWIYSNMKNN